MDYLCTLDNGAYEKYSDKLRIIFVEEGVDGPAIKDIDKPSLRDWGISSFKDRSSIFNYCQAIINQNIQPNDNINDNTNEGAPHTFV